ncbi:MAG TPA: M48 family metallopeptidase [Sulfurimonas sp.]|nr:M48 family metallopeptidase [Sulfurimonas sp.]
MSLLKARLFDKQSSGFDDISIEFKDDILVIYFQASTKTYILNELTFSQRLGNMPRFIYLNDGKVCECNDNDSIDEVLKKCKLSTSSRFIHHIESKSIYILPALAITALVIFAFLKYFVPYCAEKIAQSLPQSISSQIGSGTLVAMDKFILEPTHLSKNKQTNIQNDFADMSLGLKGLPPLNLEFRFSKKIGANAFALPDGTIIMTDQLVLLSHNNKELLSILAHEIGHIKHRHTLRMLFQNSAVFVIITTITGDATAASSLISTLPTILIESSFSRDLEAQADDYAILLMKRKKIPLHNFSNIMSRLSKGEKGDKIKEYFASHPVTSSRISKFKE